VFRKDCEYRENLGRIVADMNRAMDEGGMWIWWLLNVSLRTQVSVTCLSHIANSFAQSMQNSPFLQAVFVGR
jgi:hypothetical protein